MSGGEPFAIPEGWSWAKVGDVVTRIEAGSSFRCVERPPESGEPAIIKISAVTWGEFRPDQSKVVLDRGRLDVADRIVEGDFLFSRANTLELVGACVIAGPHEQELYLSDKILRFRFAGEFKNWLLWWLRTPEGRKSIQSASSGNQLSMRNIGQQAIQDLPLPLPPLPEQHRIVERIEALLAKGAKAKVALDTLPALLDGYRQSLLAAAFRGDLTADWRAGRSLVTALEWLNLLQKSNLSARSGRASKLGSADRAPPPIEFPLNWTVATLADLSWDADYGTSAKCDYDTPGEPVLRIPNVTGNQIFLADLKRSLSPLGLQDLEWLAAGDLLVIRTNGSKNLIGRSTVVLGELPERMHFASYLIRFRLYSDPTLHRWINCIWDAPAIRTWMESRAASSAGQHNVSLSELNSLRVPLPPREEALEIIERLSAAFEKLRYIENAFRAATTQHTTLTQSILAKAFRGELVPQDPADEPASVLLDRIRAERVAEVAKPRRRKREDA